MPVPFLNQATGQIELYAEQDLTPENLAALGGRGLRQATPEDVANRERTLQYSTVAQQSLAQAERAVRGATLGQIEGIGSDEEIRARAEVSEEVSPVLSMAADFAAAGGAKGWMAQRRATMGAGAAAKATAAPAAPAAGVQSRAMIPYTGGQQAAAAGGNGRMKEIWKQTKSGLLWGGGFGLANRLMSPAEEPEYRMVGSR